MGHAIKKAVSLAQPGDKVIALHVPKLVPEMMLTSMSDHTDYSDDMFAALSNLPTKAGENLLNEMKIAAAEQMKALSKDVDITYQVSQPSSDIKTRLLASCTVESANMLVIGAGIAGNGSVPPFVVSKAKKL